ncbi:MAG: S8 family serine peptidase, partial [Halobacteriales archaeon]|nr:S8 family serine peptidase [Halobacteriales archaeon]
NLAQDNDLPIFVVAAGNDSNDGFGTQEARWGSPMAYAGLVLDPPVPGAPNPILVVESVAQMAGATGGATRSGFSNLNGHISAPGSGIVSTVTGNTYSSMNGTSMASPHVTGLISYLYALEPDLTHEQVFDVLHSNAIAVDGDASPRIDAFASVMDVDRVFGGSTARLALLDVNGDGVFDEDDLGAAVSAFDDFTAFDTSCSVPMSTTQSCPIYSRFDLNGSGLGGDDGATRFDLDNSGSYDAILVTIAGTDVTFDQSGVTDLNVLCYNAFSSLYTGDTDQREDLLSDRCREIRVTLDDQVVQEVTIDLPDPVEGEVGADVMFNVDLSGSFFDDLSTFQSQASAIVGALQTSLSDLRVGVTSFVDAPCESFGDPGSGDYGHNLDLALTNDFDAFQAILDALEIYWGADGPESQLESMYQTMTGAGLVVEEGSECDGVADIPGSTPGWAVDRLRFVMHSTDAQFHRPSDAGYPYPTSVADVITTATETGTRIYVLDSGGG